MGRPVEGLPTFFVLFGVGVQRVEGRNANGLIVTCLGGVGDNDPINTPTVPLAGFEPAACGLGLHCSVQLSYKGGICYAPSVTSHGVARPHVVWVCGPVGCGVSKNQRSPRSHTPVSLRRFSLFSFITQRKSCSAVPPWDYVLLQNFQVRQYPVPGAGIEPALHHRARP